MVSAGGDGGSASRLDRPLEVPHPRVAAAALLQQHASVKSQKKTKPQKPEQVHAADQQPYMKHAVHVSLGDVSQLLGQPGLHGAPLHLVAAGEQVQQQPAVLHTTHTFQL